MVKEMIKLVVFGATVSTVLFLLEKYDSIQHDKSTEEWHKAYRKGQLVGEWRVYSDLDRYATSPVDAVREIDRYIMCPFGDDTEVNHFHFRVEEVK